MFRLYHSHYSFNDYFSWEMYDWLPKTSGDTNIFLFGHNPLVRTRYNAWHTKSTS